HLVGFAGDGVGFVNECWNAAHLSGEDRRGGSEPAHPENDLRFEPSVNGTATPETFVESTNKSQDGRRKRRGQPNGRQLFERNFRMFLQRQRIDILFRNEKQHLVSARAQHLRDGKSREEVSASSSA